MESFSPYSTWLNLSDSPKNFYELLGLPLFENDLQAVSSAADRQMARLTPHLSTSRGAIAQRVLTEVAQARSMLTGAGKAEYDSLLSARLGPTKAAQALPTDDAAWAVELEHQQRTRAAGRSSRQPSGAKSLIFGAVLATVLIGGAVVVLMKLNEPVVIAKAPPSAKPSTRKPDADETRKLLEPPQLNDKNTAPPEVMSPALPPKPLPEVAVKPATETPKPTPISDVAPPKPAAQPEIEKPAKPITDPAPTPQPAPEPSATELTIPKATEDQILDVKRAIASAVSQAGRRRFSAADDSIDVAIIHAATPEIAEQARDAELFLLYNRDFWNAVRQQIARMKPGESVPVSEDDMVAVVETKNDTLTVRASGRNRVYTIDDMPAKLAYSLASLWLDKNDPKSKVVLGAFHAIDARGDRETARRLWNEAVEQGVDADFLLELLDVDVK